MDNEKIIRYVVELSMLKVLFSKNLISEYEYELLEERLKKDYEISCLEIT